MLNNHKKNQIRFGMANLLDKYLSAYQTKSECKIYILEHFP